MIQIRFSIHPADWKLFPWITTMPNIACFSWLFLVILWGDL